MEVFVSNALEDFRQLADALPQFVWVTETDGSLSYVNRQWRDFSGLDLERTNDQATVAEIFHPDDRAVLGEAWAKAFESGEALEVEARMRRRESNEYCWFLIRSAPVKDAGGKVLKWFGTSTDINSGKQAESRLALLAELSELTRTLFNANELLYAVAKAVGANLQVKRCLFNEIDLDGDREIVHRDYCDGVESVAGEHRISEYSSVTSAAMTRGETVVNRDSKRDARTAPDYESTYEPNGERAYVAVPLLRENRWVASLWVSCSEPRAWSAQEVALLETVAERIWTAVEKLRIDAALDESEERFRLLSENAEDYAIIFLDAEARIKTWNVGAERILGWTESEVVGQPGAIIFTPEDRDGKVPEKELAAAAFAGHARDERWHLRRDGSRFFAVGEMIALYDDAGALRGYAKMFRDLTERKRVDDALRESEENFRAMADNISQLAWIAEADGSIFWYNRRWFDYTGTTLERMRGWGWRTVHHPDYVEPVTNRFKRALAAGAAWEDTFPLRSASGEYRWFLSRALPIRDADENIVRWFGTNTDITERRRVEADNQLMVRLNDTVNRLTEAEEITAAYARMLAEHLGADRCAYAEVEADEDHFLITGDYARGGAVQSIVGRYAMSQFGSEALRLSRENVPYVVADADADGRITAQDLTAYKQTQIRAVICVPLHKSGKFAACMAVHQTTARDWTDEEIELVRSVVNRCWESIERARAARNLRESLAREQELRRQAEDANRLKDEFLATVSHELRTPLNAILGWAAMARQSGYDQEMMLRAFEIIERNARSQNQIISDILDVSRIITGKLNLNLQPLELAPVILAAVDTLRPAIDAKRIGLETRFDARPEIITGDADRLQQIVWNLLSNAVKFTPEGGEILIRLEYCGGDAEISISDNGGGVAPEFMPFVFDRFRQADGTTNRKHGGLGLGLAIVRHLVELHGGSVCVESGGANQGSIFTVCLPLGNRSAASGEADSKLFGGTAANSDAVSETNNSPAQILKELKILVVDDERDALELASFILTANGATVFTADSAAAALELFERGDFDVLVSDIGMPEQDGFYLVREIKARENGRKRPAATVALTAYAGEEDSRRILRAGFQAYLSKPVEPSELVEKIIELTAPDPQN